MKPNNIQKRKNPDFDPESQPSKRQCVEVSKKPVNSVHQKDARSYEILSKVASLDHRFCVIQIMKADEYMDGEGITPERREQITADLDFIIKLMAFIDQLRATDLEPETISKLCFNLIILINARCLIIRNALEAFYSKKFPSFKNTTIDNLIGKILSNPYNDEQLILYAHSLTTLKNIQRIYIPYVICDNNKALALGKNALFWNDESCALEIFKKMAVPPVEGSPGFKKVLKRIYEVLEEYRQYRSFNNKTNAELIELYKYTYEGSGIKPTNISKESSKPVRNGSGSSIPKLSRSFSCHNGLGLENPAKTNYENK